MSIKSIVGESAFVRTPNCATVNVVVAAVGDSACCKLRYGCSGCSSASQHEEVR
jgi:hypothetical protein